MKKSKTNLSTEKKILKKFNKLSLKDKNKILEQSLRISFPQEGAYEYIIAKMMGYELLENKIS